MIGLSGVSDEELLASVAAGEAGALEALYDRYASRVLGLAVRLLDDRAAAEEVVQETFWRVWKHASVYQPERGLAAAWMFTIARRYCIDILRKRRPSHADEEVLEAVPDPTADVAARVDDALQTADVQGALYTLPADQRQVLELAYFRGLTRQEIAAATGVALGTIHTRARLGLQKLRAALAEHGIEV